MTKDELYEYLKVIFEERWGINLELYFVKHTNGDYCLHFDTNELAYNIELRQFLNGPLFKEQQDTLYLWSPYYIILTEQAYMSYHEKDIQDAEQQLAKLEDRVAKQKEYIRDLKFRLEPHRRYYWSMIKL